MITLVNLSQTLLNNDNFWSISLKLFSNKLVLSFDSTVEKGKLKCEIKLFKSIASENWTSELN